MRILLTGGGSGGHIFPLIAVAQELKKQNSDVEFLYVGTYGAFHKQAQQAMQAEGIRSKHIFAAKARRYFSLHYVVDVFFKGPVGFFQALWHLLWYMPDVIFSKGGYVSVPVVLVAWIYHIPVLTHESDAVPGWANRIIGKFSRYVAISYPSTRKYFLDSKTVLTGNPVRPEIIHGDAARGRQRWGLSESRPIVFVMGGSLGARAINNAMITILSELIHHAQILHVTGHALYDEVVLQAGEQGVKPGHDSYSVHAFLSREEMADAYACANLVISRAGANSISEIAANHKVSILIPLANIDQKTNAFEVSRTSTHATTFDPLKAYQVGGIGGALVLEESNLGPHVFLEKIKRLLGDEELCINMSKKIAVFYHRDAAKNIAEGILLMNQKDE